MKYIIIEETDKYRMQDSVSKKIKEGYHLIGDLNVIKADDSLNIKYVQSMIKLDNWQKQKNMIT